jgi:hypothetical protein
MSNNLKSFQSLLLGGYGLQGTLLYLRTNFPISNIFSLQSLSILKSFKQENDRKSQRVVILESIDKSIGWAYFDGASQGSPPICGAGCGFCIY